MCCTSARASGLSLLEYLDGDEGSYSNALVVACGRWRVLGLGFRNGRRTLDGLVGEGRFDFCTCGKGSQFFSAKVPTFAQALADKGLEKPEVLTSEVMQ